MPSKIKSALFYSKETTEHDFSPCLAEMGKDSDLPTLSVVFDMEKLKTSDIVQENREFQETHLQITFEGELDADAADSALYIAKKYKINVLALAKNAGLIVNSDSDLSKFKTIQQDYIGKRGILINDIRPKAVLPA